MSDTNTNSESPQELEQHANEKRSEINRTLSQIEQQFSPNQIVDQAMGMFRGNGEEMARNLGRTIRDNPMPVILTGVGLAWMALSQNANRRDQVHHYGYPDDGRGYDRSSFSDRRERGYHGYGRGHPDDRQRAEDAPVHPTRPGKVFDTASSPAADSGARHASGSSASHGSDSRDDNSSIVDKTRELGERAGEKTRELGDKASERAREMGDRARQLGDETQERFDDLRSDAAERYRQGVDQARYTAEEWRYRTQGYLQDVRGTVRSSGEEVTQFLREQPLVAGAAGIAIGALIGALLPPTRTEDRLAGKHSDAITGDIAEKADETLQQGAREARQRVEKATESVAQTAKEKVKKAESKIEQSTDRKSTTIA